MDPISIVFPASVVGLIATCTIAPRLLERPAAQAFFARHGGWLGPASWLAGLGMVLAPFVMGVSRESPGSAALAVAGIMYGPLLIALVNLAIRDGRRVMRDEPAPTEHPVWVKVACGAIAILGLISSVIAASGGAYSEALKGIAILVLFGWIVAGSRFGSGPGPGRWASRPERLG